MEVVPDCITKIVCDAISKALKDETMLKDMQYRIGYAKGMQDAVKWLMETGNLREVD